MKKFKLTDTAAPVYESVDFNYILTKVLSEEVNIELSLRYGNEIRVDMEKSGEFYVVIDRTKERKPNKKDLEREVMDIIAQKYGESYMKAKARLAAVEGVNLREIE